MKITNHIIKEKNNQETSTTIYNLDFQWPIQKKIDKRQAPLCTVSITSEKSESVANQEYERKLTDFQALFNRFPYLKDVLCKINADKINNLVKEKHQTTYNANYKSKHKSNTSRIIMENYDNKRDELIRNDKRGILKKHEISRCSVKYAGISPPEPLVIPISEYQSTIHAIGTRIIKDQLLNPKANNVVQEFHKFIHDTEAKKNKDENLEQYKNLFRSSKIQTNIVKYNLDLK